MSRWPTAAFYRRSLPFFAALSLSTIGLTASAQASVSRGLRPNAHSVLATAKWIYAHCETLVPPSLVQADLKIPATLAPKINGANPYYECGYGQNLESSSSEYSSVSVIVRPTYTSSQTAAKTFAEYARARGSHGRNRPGLGTQAFEDNENGYLEVFSYTGTVFIDIEVNNYNIPYGDQAVLIRHIFNEIAAAGY